MRNTLAADDMDRAKHFEADVETLISLIEASRQRLPDRHAFGHCVIRNLVMNGPSGNGSTLRSMMGVSADYATIGPVVQTLYYDLLGIDEITLKMWSSVTDASMDIGIRPSVKHDFTEVLGLEIAFSASPEIRRMSVQKAVDTLRGAGIASLIGGPGGIVFAGITGHASLEGAATGVAFGVGGYVFFVTMSQIHPLLEESLRRGIHKFRVGPRKEE